MDLQALDTMCHFLNVVDLFSFIIKVVTLALFSLVILGSHRLVRLLINIVITNIVNVVGVEPITGLEYGQAFLIICCAQLVRNNLVYM